MSTQPPVSGDAAADTLFAAYTSPDVDAGKPFRDEAMDPQGKPRKSYEAAAAVLRDLGPEELRERMRATAESAKRHGAMLRVTGEEKHKVYPMDLVPRILDAKEWAELARGIEQRALALNAFLHDIYGEQRILKAGVLSSEDLERAPGYDAVLGGAHRAPVHAHVCGVDLIRDDSGTWVVLEDNLRVPAGVSFAAVERAVLTEVYPELYAPYDLRDPEAAYPMLRKTLQAAAPAEVADEPALAVLSIGPHDTAYFEHEKIAERIGARVLTADMLIVKDGYLHYTDENGTYRVDVVLARVAKKELFEQQGADGEILGPALLSALEAGRVVFVNAFGNGAADDKAIYPFVPEMIRFYLDAEPLLDQVPTYLCHDDEQCAEVLDKLAEMVVKPVDGQGGEGITIGPDCSEEELEERRLELREHPERFIAQKVVRLSTLPVFDGTSMQPRHVDLRAMVHVRHCDGETTAHAVPACLTRTAPAGSMVVNSSKGGGGKDTWLLCDKSETEQ